MGSTTNSHRSQSKWLMMLFLLLGCCLSYTLALQHPLSSFKNPSKLIQSRKPPQASGGAPSSSIINRRNLLLSSAWQVLLTAPLVAAAAEVSYDPTVVQSLPTGVQYRDDRIGQGPLLPNDATVVLHVRAMRLDGQVLFDTRQDGSPLLHQLGSVVDANFFKNAARSKITIGLDDALRNMREGGIRRIAVPGPLAYGSAGVSRYDAYQMGLRVAVPRNDMIRYEVEVLRCQDMPVLDDDGRPTTTIRQACCTEPNYPCATDTDQPPSAEEEAK
jgi:hypothetical protein